MSQKKLKSSTILSDQYLSELAISHHESTRQFQRLALSFILANRDGIPLAEAHSNVVIEEKERLLQLMNTQMAELKRLNTPLAILKEKQRDITLVENILKRLRNSKSSKKALSMLLADLVKQSDAGMVQLSTRFVDGPAYTFLTSAAGRRTMKRLLEG
jgi:hypothetical protein